MVQHTIYQVVQMQLTQDGTPTLTSEGRKYGDTANTIGVVHVLPSGRRIQLEGLTVYHNEGAAQLIYMIYVPIEVWESEMKDDVSANIYGLCYSPALSATGAYWQKGCRIFYNRTAAHATYEYWDLHNMQRVFYDGVIYIVLAGIPSGAEYMVNHLQATDLGPVSRNGIDSKCPK